MLHISIGCRRGQTQARCPMLDAVQIATYALTRRLTLDPIGGLTAGVSGSPATKVARASRPAKSCAQK